MFFVCDAPARSLEQSDPELSIIPTLLVVIKASMHSVLNTVLGMAATGAGTRGSNR